MPLVNVKLLKKHNDRSKGAVLSVDARRAEVMVARKIARYEDDDEPEAVDPGEVSMDELGADVPSGPEIEEE